VRMQPIRNKIVLFIAIFYITLLFHQLEVAGGMLAPGADEVGGEFVAFVDVAADVADPTFLV